MKVIVLGGGVVGITCAYYLHRDGHQVTVIDRESGPARETSHANGGQISWSAAQPWAAPGTPATALRWLFRSHSPLVWRPRLDPAMWSWLSLFLRNCTTPRFRRHRERLWRLGRLSYQSLQELRRETGIRYSEQARGTLLLYRDPREFDAACADHASLAAEGIRSRILDVAGCIAHEPALARSPARLAGGILFPDDESGDCRQFTETLAQRLQAEGVTFHYGTQVGALRSDGACVLGVDTDRGQFTAESYVLATGVESPLLVQPLGLRLPVYPLKGYSLTLPVTRPEAAPLGSLTDETYKVVITRLGDRLRAAGTAELTGYDRTLNPSRLRTIAHAVRTLFPEAGDMEAAEGWAGLRPMTPDNVPVLGPTRYANLFLNTGHGTLGWTLACGSGRLLADWLAGRPPSVNPDGLTLERFR
jgi:D-amino-acid dehydrogenase